MTVPVVLLLTPSLLFQLISRRCWNSRYGEERETRKYSELSKSTQERKGRNERKTLWTFKMDPREEGKDRKTMWTFKMDPIPSESSVFNGAIFGPAIFLVILCTSINKDWKYKDKDKGAIVGPPIFLRLNYKDWKYKSCPLVLFSTSTLSQIFTRPFKIIQIKKNRTVFLDSQIISSAKILWQSRRR